MLVERINLEESNETRHISLPINTAKRKRREMKYIVVCRLHGSMEYGLTVSLGFSERHILRVEDGCRTTTTFLRGYFDCFDFGPIAKNLECALLLVIIC